MEAAVGDAVHADVRSAHGVDLVGEVGEGTPLLRENAGTSRKQKKGLWKWLRR